MGEDGVLNENVAAEDVPPADNSILHDVVAFVEVRSNNENRSQAISRELEQLGARVDKKFSNEVTHVIYKEGTKRTRDKAKKRGIHLVSVLWVDSCKQSQDHVPESMFPANLPDPNIPFYLAKQKKPKCVQPSNYEEDLARISDKLNKRRMRNLMVEKWKSSGSTPTNSPGNILVEDTQPRTPVFDSSSSSTPIRLAIPETPPSMKARLESLQKAKALQAELSAKKSGNEVKSPLRGAYHEPLQRKLFHGLTGTTEVLSEENELTASDVDNKALTEESPIPGGTDLPKFPNTSTPENKAIQPQKHVSKTEPKFPKKKQLTMKRLLSLKENSPQSVLVGPDSTPSNGFSCSPLFICDKKEVSKRPLAKAKGRKRKVSSDEDSDLSENDESINPSKLPKCDSKSPSPLLSIPQHLAAEMMSGPCIRRSRRRSIHSPFSSSAENQKKLSQESKRSSKGRRQTIQLEDLANDLKPDFIQMEKKVDQEKTRLNSVTSNSTFISQSGANLTQNGAHGISMSLAYGDSTLSSTLGSSTLAPPRPSIDEFRLNKKRHKKKLPAWASKDNSKSKDIKTGVNSKGAEEESGFSSGAGDKVSPQKGGLEFRKPKSRKIKEFISGSSSGADSEGETAQVKNVSKITKHNKSIVMTSLHTHEQEVIISVVKQLGECYMTDMVGEQTTHVVCGEGRRTLNVLYAIARGCWLVSNTWVLQSLEAGKWLDEKNHELVDKFPAAKLSRQEREATAGVYKKPFFSSVGLIYVCKKTKPPREHLVSLIQLCGGQVTTCQRKAQVIVGAEFHPDIVSVSPQWILDTISQFKLQPFNSYLTSQPKRQSSPEF